MFVVQRVKSWRSAITCPPENKTVQGAAEKISASDISKTASNLVNDTKSNQELVDSAVTHLNDLTTRTKYGVLRCDYEYIPTRGDPGEASSFTSQVEIRKVEGWTFEAVQRGISSDGKYSASEFRLKKADGSIDAYWTKLWKAFPDSNGSSAKRTGYRRVSQKIEGDKYVEGYFDENDYINGEVYRYDPEVIEQKMKETVKELEKFEVCGISADVGYSQAFQDNVKQMTSLPVILSSLQQLSLVAPLFDVRPESGNKIVVMCANFASFDADKLIPSSVNNDCIHIVGLENSAFGKWVGGGNSFSRFKADAFDSASVEEALESICNECEKVMETIKSDGGRVVCIVQECAELPAYSNGLRRRFKLPVYDTMTAINFVQTGCGPTSYSSYMM